MNDERLFPFIYTWRLSSKKDKEGSEDYVEVALKFAAIRIFITDKKTALSEESNILT